MSAELAIDIPVELPAHWRTEHDSVGNVLVNARDERGQCIGWVTVDERSRSFGLGMCRPRGHANESEYAGRGWRAQLYTRAVKALQDAIGPIRTC
jgi:hypothetical protein